MLRPRLLVVDDDKVVATMVCRIAESVGFKVSTTSSIELLSSEYKSFEPDIIVLDILMPDIDGFEVLRFIGESHKDTSVIILSGTKSPFRKMAERMGKEFGVSIIANVSKPFTISYLQSILEQARKLHPLHAAAPQATARKAAYLGSI